MDGSKYYYVYCLQFIFSNSKVSKKIDHYKTYGKLVTLLHLADGEGIIRMRNKNNPDENIYLDFLFQRKEKGGKLTVI